MFYMMKNEHAWLSTFGPDNANQVVMSRAQRMMTLLFNIFLGIMVAAIFYGQNEDNEGKRWLTAFICILCMYPSDYTIPSIYEHLNSLQSGTQEDEEPLSVIIINAIGRSSLFKRLCCCIVKDDSRESAYKVEEEKEESKSSETQKHQFAIQVENK